MRCTPQDSASNMMSEQGLSIILGTALGLLALLLLCCIFVSWRRRSLSSSSPQDATNEQRPASAKGAAAKNPFENVVPYVSAARQKPQGSYHRASLEDDGEMAQTVSSPGFRNPFVNRGGSLQKDRFISSQAAAANARAARINDAGTGTGTALSRPPTATANPVCSSFCNRSMQYNIPITFYYYLHADACTR